MATSSITFNPEELIGKINELEKVLLPRAAYQALNKSVFDATQRLKSEAKRRFTNPVPFTLKSFLYSKPKQIGNDQLEATVFIRDDAPKGNAPTDYLTPQISGGTVWRTRFQRRLKARGFLGGSQGQYMVPGHLAVNSSNQIYKTEKKKLSPGEYTKALWGISGFEDLRLSGKYGRKNYRTAGSYVFVPDELDSMAEWSDELAARASMVRSLNKGKIPPAGIYQVMKSSLRQKFFMIDNVPTVGRKFDFLEPAKDEVEKSFREHLLKNLKR